jgi:hypothetical protein
MVSPIALPPVPASFPRRKKILQRPVRDRLSLPLADRYQAARVHYDRW